MSYQMFKNLRQFGKSKPGLKFVFPKGEVKLYIPYTGFADTYKTILNSIVDRIKKKRESEGTKVSADVNGLLFYSRPSVTAIEIKGHAGIESKKSLSVSYIDRWNDGIHVADFCYEGNMVYEIKFSECKNCTKERCVLDNKILCEQELSRGISAAIANGFGR